jgi:hypothetical protein
MWIVVALLAVVVVTLVVARVLGRCADQAVADRLRDEYEAGRRPQ